MKVSAGRVLMLVENSFPQDTRVKNEADTLIGAGYAVTVIALRKKDQARSEVVDGIQVHRIPRLELFEKTPCENPSMLEKVVLKCKALIGYVSEYIYFTSACFIMSLRIAWSRGFDVIHAHNPPDTLFMVALPFKLFHKKFVFDHHDLCPELYRSRYGARNDAVARVLQWLEWCNMRLADVTIATNESYKEIHIARGRRDPDSVFVVRNGPNQGRMEVAPPNARLRQLGKTILCYIGSLNPQDGVDYLLRSLTKLRYHLNRRDFYCVVIGAGDSLGDLVDLAKKLRIDDVVEFTGFIPDADLRAYLSAADICVDPDPSSPLNDLSTWIKIMEYMAYSKPIVSFDLKETRYSADAAALFVPCNDEMAFAEAIEQLMDDPNRRKEMGSFGRERVEQTLQWSVVSQSLVRAYAALRVGRGPLVTPQTIGAVHSEANGHYKFEGRPTRNELPTP